MLRIKTIIAPSSIHGVGLFADQDIKKHCLIWEFDLGIDSVFIIDTLDKIIPKVCLDEFKTHAWQDRGMLYVPIDGARYFNHSEKPNAVSFYIKESHYGKIKRIIGGVYAKRNIKIREELTLNYDSSNKTRSVQWVKRNLKEK